MKSILPIILVALISAGCGYAYAVYFSVPEVDNRPGRYVLHTENKTTLVDSQTGAMWTYDPKEPADGIHHWQKFFERVQ